MYSTYILQSESADRLYIGQTNNLTSRIIKHNSGKIFSTKPYTPWKLIFFREFQTRVEAMAFEKKLKSIKNKNYLLNKIKLKEL